MNRLDALQLSGGALLSVGLDTSTRPPSNALTLPQLAFSVGIGTDRGIGVFYDNPLLVVQDEYAAEKRLTIPRAELQGEPRWRLTPEPSQAPATDVNTPPGSDVIYGRIPDRATALCRGGAGVYVAMVAFPALPYLVHYDAQKNEFRTHPLPASQQVIVVFEQPGRVNYIVAGTTDLRVVDAVVP
ncbi:MAG: hypothetical protein M3169_16370 [Candidatus Eremiobacteraeota bacterium]|nr:hypothetical protein [Candidatus Eremiobacteraeota bacterium]